MTDEQNLARLIREANKEAKKHKCGVHNNKGVISVDGGSGFDVRIEGVRDPLGRYMMSVKHVLDDERLRTYHTADGLVLFAVLRR